MPYLFKKYYPLRNIIFCIGEGSLIFFTFCFVYDVMIGNYLYFHYLSAHLIQAALVTFIFQLCIYFFDLYDLSRDLTLTETATRMTQAFGLGCIVLGIIYFTFPLVITSTRIFWPSYIAICCVVMLWRWAYYFILRKRLFVQNILVLGTGKFATDIAIAVEGKHDTAYKIINFIG